MPTLTLSSGATIWHRRQGRGAPLVHIHGSAFGHRNFERLTPLMTREFEVIDFDLPGYGQSHGGPPGQGMAGLADDVAEFIGKLESGRVHLHGTSFGAMIALTVAANHGHLIDRLVLSCFLARYDKAARMMRSTWKRAARDSGMAAVADLTSVAGFARTFYESDWAEAQLASMREAFALTQPEAFIASTETIERSDLSDLVNQVAAPTLLLAGAEDNMTPFRPAGSGVGMHDIAQRLASCETEVLPQCGHYLVIEQAEAAAARIGEFLRRPE
jgi:3-oxoadipate enol-lactonase